MKKTVITILLALALGSAFGIYMFKDNEDKLEKVITFSDNVTLFQLGVFSNYENAKKLKEDKKGIIIVDKDRYRVIKGILKNEESIDKYSNYLDTANETYYLKKTKIDNEQFITYLEEVEVLLNKTNDLEVIDKLINQILDKYKELKVKYVN